MSETFRVPVIAVAFVQYYIAKRLLEAQIDARKRLSAIAFTSLEKAENLFAAFMELREYDQQVYDYLKALPQYEICDDNIQRGRITGHLQHAQLLKRGVFGHSRYNCGNREEAISLALSQGLIAAGENMVNAHIYEELLQDGYDQLRWTSLSTSAAFNEFNPTSVFSSVAEQLARQDATLLSAAGSSLFAFGNTARGLVRDIFSDKPTKVGGDFANTRSNAQSTFEKGIRSPDVKSNTTDLSRKDVVSGNSSPGTFSGRTPTQEI